MNDRVSMDGVTWTAQTGATYHFYHVIDESSAFQLARACPRRDTESAIQALKQIWLHWAGPCKELWFDDATEFSSEDFATFLQSHNIQHRMIATDAHWQLGRAERHGGILQTMLSKYEAERPITDLASFQEALEACCTAKNQLSRVYGYTPEILVLGKSTVLPGSVISDESCMAHSLAAHDGAEGLAFRDKLFRREVARRAFVSTDNSDALRRAALRRSRPQRGSYQCGDCVMFWKVDPGSASGRWHGPSRVLSQDANQVVWISQLGRLYRVSPEHVRLATLDEQRDSVPETWQDIRRKLQNKSGPHKFLDLSLPAPVSQSPSVPGGPDPFSDAAGTVSENSADVSARVENMPTEGGYPHAETDTPIDAQPDVEPSGSESMQINDSRRSSLGDPSSLPVSHQAPSHQIPVPADTDDDELVVIEDPFQLPESSCWVCEVFITDADIHEWRHAAQPSEMAFVASAAKRQRAEVRMSQLSEEHKREFDKAKACEIDSWLKTSTVERILRHKIPSQNLLRCRWVLTWKPVDEESSSSASSPGVHHEPNPKPKQKAKARLVILGFEDPLIDQIPRDSPTLSRDARMLALQYISSRKWTVGSFDVKTAFLRGRVQSDRVLGLEPPSELRERLKLRDDEVCRLLKGAYGLVNAPYLWYQELSEALAKLHFRKSPLDPCLFVLVHPETQEVCGVIGIHVDDGLCGGNDYFKEQLGLLERQFPFGANKATEFKFTGIHVKQNPDFSISLDQTEYVRDIPPICINKSRRLQKDSKVSEEERHALRALIGSLQYAAVNTRPDLSRAIGGLQSKINKACVEDLLWANQVLHDAKRHAEVSITLQPIAVADLRFVCFSDASFASDKDPASHRGMLIMASDQSILNAQTSPISPISWTSKKIQRTVTSTLASETFALSGCLDQLMWTRLHWGWLCNPELNWRTPEETLSHLPEAACVLPHLPEAACVVDCKSLFDLLNKTATPQCSEFRTLLEALSIKERLQEGVVVRWVHSAAQLADVLTKIMDGTIIRQCLAQRMYKLHDSDEVLRQRADKRARLRWMHEN